MIPVTIRRRKKHEAEMAIADLEKKGFIVTFPLTEKSFDGKVFTTDSYQRKIFQQNTHSSSWYCQMKKEGK